MGKGAAVVWRGEGGGVGQPGQHMWPAWPGAQHVLYLQVVVGALHDIGNVLECLLNCLLSPMWSHDHALLVAHTALLAIDRQPSRCLVACGRPRM
jgi:hypothetical protein